MDVYLVALIEFVLLALYILDLRKHKITTKEIVMIGLNVAISYVLYIIPLVRYPQGGGITFFSMLPIMLLSLVYGRTVGVTGGLIFGLLKTLNGAFIVHPVQFFLDYILANMALGLAGTFGIDKKYKIFLGSFMAGALSTFISVVSGVVFFGQYAPPGMNLWIYSIIYNVSSAGVESFLTTIVLTLMPIQLLARRMKPLSNRI
ncbi:energy-coupled thiamine transporter ThiT [Clostridium sp. LIBA-8841]|uniref:energy-coupled thiamine transporter ThiT n=1 Tax=Clostridium sp. LIBA-8841 TaxID=2987530 RepID=UPI002AC3CAAA|nr:energy-coupled thiamine transporter ThiT [Clostridium sp. LIBA-8841]MDZ5254734.1 energy-coupled thiamine transporter ThiT [Clostridium sp. LIBA-8841]